MKVSNKKYQRGRNKEYYVVKAMKEAGFYSCRSAGSHSLFDVISFDKEELVLIQVKSVTTKYYSFKQEEKEIREFDNCPLGTRKELWIYLSRLPKRKACRIRKVIQ